MRYVDRKISIFIYMLSVCLTENHDACFSVIQALKKTCIIFNNRLVTSKLNAISIVLLIDINSYIPPVTHYLLNLGLFYFMDNCNVFDIFLV